MAKKKGGKSKAANKQKNEPPKNDTAEENQNPPADPPQEQQEQPIESPPELSTAEESAQTDTNNEGDNTPTPASPNPATEHEQATDTARNDPDTPTPEVTASSETPIENVETGENVIQATFETAEQTQQTEQNPEVPAETAGTEEDPHSIHESVEQHQQTEYDSKPPAETAETGEEDFQPADENADPAQQTEQNPERPPESAQTNEEAFNSTGESLDETQQMEQNPEPQVEHAEAGDEFYQPVGEEDGQVQQTEQNPEQPAENVENIGENLEPPAETVEGAEKVTHPMDENLGQTQHTENFEASTEAFGADAGATDLLGDGDQTQHPEQTPEQGVEFGGEPTGLQDEGGDPFQPTEQDPEPFDQGVGQGEETTNAPGESSIPVESAGQDLEPPTQTGEVEEHAGVSDIPEDSNNPTQYTGQEQEPTTDTAAVGESEFTIDPAVESSDPAQHTEQMPESPFERAEAGEKDEVINAPDNTGDLVQQYVSGVDEGEGVVHEFSSPTQYAEESPTSAQKVADSEDIANVPDVGEDTSIRHTEEKFEPPAGIGEETITTPVETHDEVQRAEAAPETPVEAVQFGGGEEVSDKQAEGGDHTQQTEQAPEPFIDVAKEDETAVDTSFQDNNPFRKTERKPEPPSDFAEVVENEAVFATPDEKDNPFESIGRTKEQAEEGGEMLPAESFGAEERAIGTPKDPQTQHTEQPEATAACFDQPRTSTSNRRPSPSLSMERSGFSPNVSPKWKRVDKPLARSLMSPMASPAGSPKVPPEAPSIPHSTAPSFATALHSPGASPAAPVPPYSLYQEPSPHTPTRRAERAVDPYYASSFQAIKELSLNSAPPRGKGPISPPTDEKDDLALLGRIQSAIPDINRLLSGFRDTQSKLSSRETEIRQLESQHEQALAHKDYYIEALQAQMKRSASESAEESMKLKNTIYRLKFEVQNLQEKQRELEQGLESSEVSNKKLQYNYIELEDLVNKLNVDAKDTRETHAKAIEKQKQERKTALSAQKRELTELFEEIKIEALKVRENELRATHSAELQGVRDTHLSELDTLKSNHEEQLTAAAKELDDKLNAAKKRANEKDQRWTEEVRKLERLLTDYADKLSSSERQKEMLEEVSMTKERQLQRAVEEMRVTVDRLGGDSERMKRTLQSLGEATDLKSSKGDSFFLDAFGRLSRLIVDLSREHFSFLPIDPPKDIISKIPSGLPPFFDNTRASRELRSAYVQHVISKTLTYRIFQPFLFTLGRRYDKADTFFQMLSMDIRRKSVRREAFWRQQTLKAAYTASDAKQSINVVAAVIVEEIIDHIRHFADPKQLEALIVGVRQIVKLAAETWRHARVERELVLADLPAAESGTVLNEEWEEYGEENGQRDDYGRRIVLRTFPRITREAAHEDFTDDREKIISCVYSRGIAVYSDSPVVTNRLKELSRESRESRATDQASGIDSLQSGSRNGLRSSTYSSDISDRVAELYSRLELT